LLNLQKEGCYGEESQESGQVRQGRREEEESGPEEDEEGGGEEGRAEEGKEGGAKEGEAGSAEAEAGAPGFEVGVGCGAGG